MPPALTHERCRQEMCAACGGKAGQRKVTAALGDKIRSWAQPSWSPDVLSHPSGICDLCRKTVGLCDQQQTSDIPSCDGTVHYAKKEAFIFQIGLPAKASL